jgi:hypothetical protein
MTSSVSRRDSKKGLAKPKPASKLKVEKLQSIESFTEDINQQPYVLMEGEKTFDIKALPKARKMLSRYQSLSDFLSAKLI